MTENLDEILNHSNGYKDSKSLVFPTEDLFDSNGCDGTKDSLACETKARNEFFEDISRSNKHEIRALPLKKVHDGLSNLTSCKGNGNPFACDTDTHLFTDKGVVESKLPESTICYKESNYNIMKDICVDESTFKVSVDHHTTNEDEGTKSLVPNGLKPFSEDYMSKDADKDSYLEECTTTGKVTNISEKESDIQNSMESNSNADQSAQQPDQMPSSVATFNSQNAVSAADETNNNGSAFNNSKSEAGAITSAASQVHFANNVDPTNSSVHGHFADGEASFSAAGPASGLITYTGPISHSANVSLRSDSSTTSARSFAFPVLQSEWNSSPVRMSQAERRKHRSWRQSLLCCKF